jgi:glycosyltransferase involved in cell wall biosynthesis
VASRPKILILITLAEVGGAQTYVMSLLPALTRRYDVTVAAWGPGPLRAAAKAAGAEYVPLRWVRRDLHPWRDLRGLWELVALCRRIRPQLVHANSSKAGVLGRLAATIARVPVRVFTVHGWAFKAHTGAASRGYLAADRGMRALTTAIVCVSQTELEAGLRARTCTRERTVVIRNGVDANAAPRTKLDGSPPVVISVGRLKEPKTFVTLARAFARLDAGTFRGLIVGDGPDRDAVADALEDAPVELLGERDDVPALLAEADVFVLSSASEGLPLSLLEAMACGLPVVASAVGGVPELVGAAGVLVEPNDDGKLAEVLASLLADQERRRALGASARARVEREFSLAKMREQHVELYDRLLGIP